MEESRRMRASESFKGRHQTREIDITDIE